MLIGFVVGYDKHVDIDGDIHKSTVEIYKIYSTLLFDSVRNHSHVILMTRLNDKLVDLNKQVRLTMQGESPCTTLAAV